MRVLYIIAARGGSKGVPKKNIKEIGGLPLIAYKIIAAQKCKYENRIIVSTDDEEIAQVSRKYGADVPFVRPAELASDSAGSMDVVEHATRWIEENDDNKYDYVCLLEPSSPFATFEDLNKALDLITCSRADTLLGMKESEVSTNFIHELDSNGGLSFFYDTMKRMKDVSRQAQKKEYTLNGCMYIAKWDYFKKNKLFHSINSVPYIMPAEQSVEIDSMSDFYYAKSLIDNGLIDINMWTNRQ